MLKFLTVYGFAIVIFSNPAYAEEDTWSGTYLGVHSGVSASSTNLEDNGCWSSCDAPTVNFNKPAIGVAIGQNTLIDGNFLVGLEADFGLGGGASISTPRTVYVGGPTTSIDWRTKFSWTSSLRLRVGLAEKKTLLYVTGGLAATDARVSEVTMNAPPWNNHSPNYGASWNGILTGYTYGAGAEHQLGAFSVKAEFLRATYAKRTACYQDSDGPNAGQCWSSGADYLGISPSMTSLRIGVNYRF